MVPDGLEPDAGVDDMVEGVVVDPMPEAGGVIGVVELVVDGGRTVPGPAVP